MIIRNTKKLHKPLISTLKDNDCFKKVIKIIVQRIKV